MTIGGLPELDWVDVDTPADRIFAERLLVQRGTMNVAS